MTLIPQRWINRVCYGATWLDRYYPSWRKSYSCIHQYPLAGSPLGKFNSGPVKELSPGRLVDYGLRRRNQLLCSISGADLANLWKLEIWGIWMGPGTADRPEKDHSKPAWVLEPHNCDCGLQLTPEEDEAVTAFFYGPRKP
jgi:hypothetical protein